MALYKRDPFAREELHRIWVTTYQTCSWCGNLPRTPKGKGHLLQYWIERDDQNGRKEPIKGLFCSESCRRAYHS